MSGDSHILVVGLSSTPRSLLGDAPSDVPAELHRTRVETVATAERHLLGDLPFTSVLVDAEDVSLPSDIERLRAARSGVPIVVLTADDDPAAESALADVPDCKIVSRDGDLAGTLASIRRDQDAAGGPPESLLRTLLRVVPDTSSLEDALDATVRAVCDTVPIRYGEAWRPTADSGVFERVVSVADDDALTECVDGGTIAADSTIRTADAPVWVPLASLEDWPTAGASTIPVGDADPDGSEDHSYWALVVPVGDPADPFAVLAFFTDSRWDSVGAEIADAVEQISPVVRQSRRTEQLERYETIMDTVGDGVYVLDASGRYVAVNDTYVELTGYDRSELLGAEAASIVGPSRTEQGDEIQSSLESNEEVSTLRTALPTASGEAVPIEARISLFPLGDGATGRVGVVRDIRERLGLEKELGEVLERVSDAFFALDTDWQFTYVNERAAQLLQRDPEALRGNLVWDEFPAAVDSTFEREYREAMSSGESTTFVEYFPPLDTWFRVHAYPSETGLSVYFADVSDEKRRTRKLDALTGAVQSFPDAKTATAVATSTARTATHALEMPHAVVALYDGSTGQLKSVATSGSGADAVVEDVLDADVDGVAWDAYVEGESRTLDSADGTALVVPLESHGVLVAATTDPNGYSDVDVSLLNILGAHAKSALDRADREERLREQKHALEEKNASLQRVNRLNSIIRQITKVLTRAGTRETIESSVCEDLADTEPYRIAWFARYDNSDETLVPVASSGIDVDVLDPVPLDAEGTAIGRAAATETLSVVESIDDRNPPYKPWERAALKRGCQSQLAVPVLYRGELYGVLSLCAAGDDIGDLERTVLSELGETIGYAINALERKKALVSKQTVDLAFRTSAFGDPLFDLFLESSTAFELETLVQRRDGYVHAFFQVSGIETDALEAAAERSMAVESLTVVAEREAGLLVECTLSRDSFLSSLLDRGAMVKELDFEDGDVRLIVRVPQTADVRRFIDRLEEHFDEVELTARRERDEPISSVREFQSEFETRLTDRQRQVIETAYYGGFFEWPRESTGVEIAEMLGVSQPTVNRHIRRGERELFGMLFDDE